LAAPGMLDAEHRPRWPLDPHRSRK
jgi:hypothetical protein